MIKQFDKEKKKIDEEGYEFEEFGFEIFIPEAQKMIQEVKNDPYRLA